MDSDEENTYISDIDTSDDESTDIQIEEPKLDDGKMVEDAQTRRKIIISRMHYLAGKSNSVEHTRMVFGERLAGFSEDNIIRLTKKMRSDKRQIINWGRTELTQKIVRRCRHKGLNVSSLDDINELLSLTDDCLRRKMKKIIYTCTYGVIKRNKGWQVRLEKSCMVARNLEYKVGTKYVTAKTSKARGCIARLMSVANQKVMKKINKEIPEEGQVRKKKTKLTNNALSKKSLQQTN